MPGDGFWAPFKIINQNTSSMNLSVLLWNFSCMLKIVQNKPLHQWLISVSDTIFANLNFSFDDKKAITCSSIRCHSCTQLISAECDSQGRFNLSYLFLKSWDKEKLLTHFFFLLSSEFLTGHTLAQADTCASPLIPARLQDALKQNFKVFGVFF